MMKRISSAVISSNRIIPVPESLCEQRIHKIICVERNQVGLLLTDSDVTNGEPKFSGNRNDYAAFGRAIELRQHDSCDARGLGEYACLLQAILAGGCVHHQ